MAIRYTTLPRTVNGVGWGARGRRARLPTAIGRREDPNGVDPYGKKELLDFYTRHLRDHGDAPQAVRWTAAGQLRRYEAFCDVLGDLSGKTPPLLFGCCREALHVNFLSARAPRHDVELFYVDPVELLRFASDELSPGAAVREDLVPDDLFLTVRR